MSDCPQCSVAAVKAKEAFNRVIDATKDGRRNLLPSGDIDWDSFCDAVESSLTYSLKPNPKRKR